jgi:subtilisin-like proprotein convertase family protein
MVARGVVAKLGLSLSILTFASVASAQVKPRFVIAVDTSGSMRYDLGGTETNGDGVGRLPISGDNDQRTLGGIYYGCGNGSSRPRTGAGDDRDGDCFPNDSRIWIAKDAIRKMIYAFGDVEWALSRFKQTDSAANIVTNADYDVRIDTAGGSCNGTEGNCVDTYDNMNYRGICCGSGYGCSPVVAGGGQMLVGFPGVPGQAFETMDNRPALLRWMDNVETSFHAPTNTDITLVDRCDHRDGNDCELRIPPNGGTYTALTPLGGLISESGSYLTSVRNADAKAGCRQYSIILVTDGAETCNTNPNQRAFELAYPTQSGSVTCGTNTTINPNLVPTVKTYVVGLSITSSEQASLNTIAKCGGTTSAYFANSPTELSAALSTIVGNSLAFEQCNGDDDDCDGAYDESLPFGQPGSAAQPQALFCDGEGLRTPTQNAQVIRRPEPQYGSSLQPTDPITAPVVCGRVADTCSHAGFDDDCDGKMDEDGALTACGTCPGALDVCNGIDDDCDGKYDEGNNSGVQFSACPTSCLPGQDVPCGSDVGECESGLFKCVDGVLDTTVCVGKQGPFTEVCDEKDNNCNGIVDDPAILARTCTTPYGNVGICRPGVQYCAKPSLGEQQDAGGYHVIGGAPVCEGQVLPEDRELCDSLDHDCDGNNFTCTQDTCVSPNLPFVGSACGNGLGICVGQLSCDTQASPPALVCSAPSSKAETCNNIDDDCDGTIDEMAAAGPDLGNVSGGAAGAFCGTETRTDGVCNPGHYECLNGHWLCSGEAGPSLEICNGDDDDCDGTADEAAAIAANDPRVGQQCGTTTGECDPGFSVCSGGSISCTPVHGPVDETCNGKDDDCDNLVDEKLPDSNPKDGVRDIVTCGLDTGLCDFGQLDCVAVPIGAGDAADGFDYQCVGGVGQVPEICDGLDNDCDGDTDECTGQKGSPAYDACKNDPFGDLGAGGGDTCGTSVPPCSPGKTKCVADFDGDGNPGFVCAGGNPGSRETCNNMDDDCDQKVDEELDPVDNPLIGKVCGAVDVGACRVDVDNDHVTNDPDDQPCGQCRFGLNQCVNGAIDCVGVVTPKMFESCNDTDDDCDGEIDECVDPNDANCAPGSVDPNTPVGTMCGDGTGECKQGVNACEGGVLNCKNYVGPTGEVCNGKDDDCDGNTDENIPRGAPCGSSVGECKPGEYVCPPGGAGELVCKGGTGPTDEACDGLDNDCDGKTDEGLGLGKDCGSDVGVCMKGKLECQNGRTECVGEKRPEIETCDCQDNDCDGKIDETGSKTPICGKSGAECVMCQCALPCVDSTEFSAECPQGKEAVEQGDKCFCVGAACDQLACQKETQKDDDGNVLCAPNDDEVSACTCKNNTCTFRCAGVTCDGTLVCDPTDGRCRQPNCLLPQFKCGDDERCQIEGNVFACEHDPCADVECGDDEACRDGKCVKSCADVTCSGDQKCVDGECVADKCAGKTCADVDACNPETGKCVTAAACLVGGCGDGTVCDPVGGECKEDACLSTRCPYGEQCNSATGQCENRCFGSLLFCGDACVDPQTNHDFCGASGDCRGDDKGKKCKDSLVCSRGECRASCDDALVNCGGDCIDPQTDAAHCGAQDSCTDAEAGEVCKAGSSCVKGKCKAAETAPPKGGKGGEGADQPVDGTRVIASGGGGCTCSVPGAAEGAGAPGSPRRGALSMLLLAVCGALLGRRRRRALLAGSRVLLLVLSCAAALSFGSGCKVDTFCLDCPSKDQKNDDGSGSAIPGGRIDASTGEAGNGGTGGKANSGGTGGVSGSGGGGAAGDGGTAMVSDGGKCGKTELCNGLDDDCDGKTDEDVDPSASNINLKTDPNNCGKCGNVCALQHAFNLCDDGVCGIDHKQGDDGCDVGYVDIDKKDKNGCEYRCTKNADDDSVCDVVDNDCDGKTDEDVDFDNDAENCGGCNFRCSRAHAQKGVDCKDKKCVLDDTKCDDGFANVDGKEQNGCEYACPVWPTEAETCNFEDDDCDGETDEDTEQADSRIGVACGSSVGACHAGTVSCVNGAPTCTGDVIGPTQEVCDGIDNDCDGTVDTDDPTIGLPCGTATPGSLCTKGTLQIPAGGCSGGVAQELVCTGGQGPVPETCNGLDDDCDGKADEAVAGVKPEAGQKCTNGSGGFTIVSTDPPGLCQAGRTSCESGFLLCRNEVAPAANELCDGLDHDCDGNALNGFTPDQPNGTTATSGPDPRVGKNCGIDTGECAFGVQTCHLDTRTLSCDGEVKPATEICDGKDNDCDGKIDEHAKDNQNQDVPLAGEGVACITNPNGSLNTNPPATASRGECSTGVTVCSAGKLGCQGQIGPRPELCDAEDWDCDGNANNGVATTDPAVAKPCGPPSVGACHRGTTACVSNAVVCQGALPSASYVAPAPSNMPEPNQGASSGCDGVDNDCDGATDEGNPAAYNGASCCDFTSSGFMCCVQGTRQCNNGRISCVYPVGAKLPKTEVCGGGDDDCDTHVDEGFNLQTDINNCGSCGHKCEFDAPASTNRHAVLVCDAGTCKIGACDTGFVDKNSTYQDGCELPCTITGNEIYDGVDNDCNGTVDDLPSVPTYVCTAKNYGVCQGKLQDAAKCVDGALTCDIQSLVTAGTITNYEATETKCDTVDNDCDNKVDEAFPQVGNACTKGTGECTTSGVNVCNGLDAIQCNAATPGGGTPESCNGKDDDCNGTIDDFSTPTTANSVGNVEFVDLGAGTGHTLVMAYEMSRPDATSSDAGRQTSKACSVNGRQPWTSLTWAEARSACCSLNAGGTCAADGTGWRLCDSSTWDTACRGEVSGCNWGYSNEASAVCNHDPRLSTYQNVCMGAEALSTGLVSCGDDSECNVATGSATFPECRTVWSDGDIHDLSGNVQEWTNTAQGTNIYEIRGGSYNDVENGRTCDFNFAVGNTTFRFPNTGFRCCNYPASPITCTTYNSGVTAAAPVTGPQSGNLDSTFTVAATGPITDIQVLDVTGTSPNRFGDLSFALRSPDGTSLTLINSGNCGSDTAWAFDLTDSASNAVSNGNPFCSGSTVGGGVANAYRPQNGSLDAAFVGKDPAGSWRLRVNDNDNRPGSSDYATLTGWKLRICTNSGGYDIP